MNGFANTITRMMESAGVETECIFRRQGKEIPGFFRPTKEWDIVVVVNGQLLAAIELKSQVGPSFGNNFNNRTEEALGSATDLWTAYREGAFQTSPRPWLGYLFLLEDCEASSRPVMVREPHFSVFREFQNASYAVRYEWLCRKLVLERQFDAACFILAKRADADSATNYLEPASDLRADQFLNALLRHVGSR